MISDRIARELRLRPDARDEWHGACPCCHYKSGFSVTERDGKTLVYRAAGPNAPAILLALCHFSFSRGPTVDTARNGPSARISRTGAGTHRDSAAAGSV